ncbi:MAG: type II toxin-antitoxin system VapC family toxin [Pyrinomonadaceae bacterium]
MLEFASNLLIDSEISLVWVDESLTLRAVDLLNDRSDKIWSLCDAVSFVLMEEQGITEALTTDHDFEQAGFIKLLDS